MFGYPHINWMKRDAPADSKVPRFHFVLYVSEFGITQNWFQKVVSRDHQIRLRRQNSVRSEQQIDMSTPVTMKIFIIGQSAVLWSRLSFKFIDRNFK